MTAQRATHDARQRSTVAPQSCTRPRTAVALCLSAARRSGPAVGWGVFFFVFLAGYFFPGDRRFAAAAAAGLLWWLAGCSGGRDGWIALLGDVFGGLVRVASERFSESANGDV